MILAAGAGTRLRPLTETIPKALVPVLDVPMLERLAAFLGREGVDELAVNAHHLPDAMAEQLRRMAARGAAFPPVRLYREAALLGTGGGVANAADFWREGPLLVWNGDIAAELEPAELMARHTAGGALATLVTQQRDTSSHLLVDGAGCLCGVDSPRRGGRRVVRPPDGPLHEVAFHGVSVLSPALLPRMARAAPFDLIDALLDLAAEGAPVAAHDAGPAFWGSTGTPQQLAALENGLGARPELLARWTPPPPR